MDRASSPATGVGGGGSQVLGMTSGPTIRQQLDALAMVSRLLLVANASRAWDGAGAAAARVHARRVPRRRRGRALKCARCCARCCHM
jgi:hypothetical protein